MDGHGEVIGGESVSQRGAKSISQRGLCEGRKNRGLAMVGEAPVSVRGGLTRVQYP